MGQDTSEKERYRSGHNGADSKSDGGLRPTWVRIPPSPPFTRVAGKWLIISMRTRRVRILTYRDVLMPRSAGRARAATLSAIYPRSGEMAHHKHENRRFDEIRRGETEIVGDPVNRRPVERACHGRQALEFLAR